VSQEAESEFAIHDDAKRSISLRVSTTDYGKVRIIAHRLRVRESDVLRFALKTALALIAPLHDNGCRGRDLMPLLIEYGPDIARHFQLDARRLEAVVNKDVENDGGRIDLEDVELLAMSYAPQRHVFARLQEIAKKRLEPAELDQALRSYLRNKYNAAGAASPEPA
jgi:hypothetical protein